MKMKYDLKQVFLHEAGLALPLDRQQPYAVSAGKMVVKVLKFTSDSIASRLLCMKWRLGHLVLHLRHQISFTSHPYSETGRELI